MNNRQLISMACNWQGSNGVDITVTGAATPAQQASFILEFEHAQNYDNKSTVTGPV